MAAFYKINDVDMLPYLVDGGLIWEENDIDADDSGRDMSGFMWRGLVARKDKHTLKFRTLKLDEARIVTAATNSQYVIVSTNIHPKQAGTVSFSMYNSVRRGAVYTLNDENESAWTFEEMSFIER